ncbi:olfactory receptor 11A1-like [Bufo gargarizans]|uniref:olfactory receptor 11A1-like n=1 Tax=Bufo gargarizans TaxID=30331 RepID=UPI001CF23889|nr:olfactory receptor 11A1-like [Bufo gargarizans]
MSKMNTTVTKEFLLLGFQIYYYFKAPLFILFLTVYIITIIGNLLIIVLVWTYNNLNCPMYIFMSNLSFSDMMFTTNVVPNMLSTLVTDKHSISVDGCIAQFYFYGTLGSTECFLLTVMSYDRYLAICYPLNYLCIMDTKLQKYLLVACWVASFTVTLFPVVLMYQLHFCGPNVIDHFFCDLAPILALSCSDTSAIKAETMVSSIFVVLLPFLFIISSYTRIILSILQIPSTQGRQKTFSTCSAHLLVVCTYFLTIITVYSNQKEYSSTINKIRSLLYVVLTPMFNPMIYALRNKEIQSTFHKLLIHVKMKIL